MGGMRRAENALRLAPTLTLLPGHEFGDEADVCGCSTVSKASRDAEQGVSSLGEIPFRRSLTCE